MRFKSSCTLKPCTGEKDFHHKCTYGEPSYPKCNYAKKDQVVTDKGKDVLTSAWLQFPPGTVVKVDDQIILLDGTTAPVVVPGRVIHYPHNNREMCVEAYLGKGSV